MAQHKTAITDDPAPTEDQAPLPGTRDELLALHRETQAPPERRGARQP